MTEQQPDGQFVQSLDAALAFWREQIDSEPPARLERERHNLYRAVQLGLALPVVQRAAALVATSAFRFVYACGYWREWLPVMEQAASVAATAPSEARFWLLTRLGQLQRLNGKLADAVRAHRDALDVARKMEEPLIIGEAHYHLGRTLRDTRQYVEAEKQLRAAEEVLEQAAEGRAATLEANVHNALGRVAHDLGRLADAEKHLQRAVDLRRKQSQPVALADALHDLGNLYRAAGSYEEALAYHEQALSLLEATSHRLNVAQIHLSVGALHFARRDYATAESVLRQIDMPFLRETGNLHLQALIMVSVGNALLYQERYQEAARVLRESVSLWQDLEDGLELGNAVGSLGEALAGLGEKEEAAAKFTQALVLLRRFPESAKAGRLRALFASELEKVEGQAAG